MRGAWAGFGGIALLCAFAGAHCPSVPPAVELSRPAEGMAVQKACYAEYGTCFQDTFYRDTLLNRMVRAYGESRYAVVAYVDSIENFLTYDTTFYRGQPYYVDTFQTEKVWVTIERDLREPMPVHELTYIDRWVAFTNNPFATTYTPLIDTPFVAFFDAYDSIRHLGIGPMDGCFFEPTAYAIAGGEIRKKGLVGERMPGVSVAWADFFGAIGKAPPPEPGIKSNRKTALGPSRRGSGRGKPRRYGFAYDLRGRRLAYRAMGSVLR
jgi:hypothetical protein